MSDVQLAGRPRRCRRPSSRRLIRIQPGEVFSRAKLQASVKDISERLGADGYAFANVNAVPDIDRAKTTAAFTFYVDPGRRVYVRQDQHHRQRARPATKSSGASCASSRTRWYDGTRIERSKVRVRRLGLFRRRVNVETPPVPGTPDQVDIDVTVAEKSTGNLLAGVGYSSADGVVLNASISQQNIFGTGNALSLAVNTSKINRHDLGVVTSSPTGPSTASRGRSRSTTGTPIPARSTSRSTRRRRCGAAMSFGVPITETDTINAGLRVEHTNLTLFQQSPPVYYEFVREFGYATNSYILSARLVA